MTLSNDETIQKIQEKSAKYQKLAAAFTLAASPMQSELYRIAENITINLLSIAQTNPKKYESVAQKLEETDNLLTTALKTYNNRISGPANKTKLVELSNKVNTENMQSDINNLRDSKRAEPAPEEFSSITKSM